MSACLACSATSAPSPAAPFLFMASQAQAASSSSPSPSRQPSLKKRKTRRESVFASLLWSGVEDYSHIRIHDDDEELDRSGDMHYHPYAQSRASPAPMHIEQRRDRRRSSDSSSSSSSTYSSSLESVSESETSFIQTPPTPAADSAISLALPLSSVLDLRAHDVDDETARSVLSPLHKPTYMPVADSYFPKQKQQVSSDQQHLRRASSFSSSSSLVSIAEGLEEEDEEEKRAHAATMQAWASRVPAVAPAPAPTAASAHTAGPLRRPGLPRRDTPRYPSSSATIASRSPPSKNFTSSLTSLPAATFVPPPPPSRQATAAMSRDDGNELAESIREAVLTLQRESRLQASNRVWRSVFTQKEYVLA